MRQEQTLVESKRFGRYLRKIRKNRRLSLDAVEEMTHGYPERVTKSHLSRIENGEAIPTFPRMFALSQVYGVPIASMAEKFEVDLRLDMLPETIQGRASDDLVAECRKLRVAGRFVEALVIYDGLQERLHAGTNGHGIDPVELKLGQVSCLIHVSRFTTAKDECEDLINLPDISGRQKAKALQFFSMCCYRLGKFAMALITLERAEREVRELESAHDLLAHLAALKGNLLYLTGRLEEAVEVFQNAMREYDALSIPFEACRARINLSSALIDLGNHRVARGHLRHALKQAESQGYDRQIALGLSNMAMISYREDDLSAAETYCVRSNAIARSREYVSVVFRNCFYLWKIAERNKDDHGVKANLRTLRTYFSRVEDYLPEVEQYRTFVSGGEA
ncbi:MAG: helix-turn-helix domain-containing protein [bacterium]|nr:helix-turn-helix domain-containing protein [bacterium]